MRIELPVRLCRRRETTAPPPIATDHRIVWRIATFALLALLATPRAGEANKGIWLTDAEIQALPMLGPAWDSLKAQADRPAGTPNLSDQDQKHNVYVLAKALVYARTKINSYRTDVRDNCMAAINTELGGRTLSLGRELAAYVIAADLVGLKPASQDPIFKDWLRRCLTETLDGKTLQSTHEERPNNWGTMCGASRAAVAIYLGDDAELARTAQVFKGYLGDTSWAGFEFTDLSWQADTTRPVGIDPLGSIKGGHSVSGVLTEEMARGCSFQFPPCYTGYPWEALQGAVLQAQILSRRGYPAWQWQDHALIRAVQLLYDLNTSYGSWWATGDDNWVPWVVNSANALAFPTALVTSPGKNMAWTDWTHGQSTVGVEPEVPAGPAALWLGRPTPDPAIADVSIPFSISRAGPVRLEAFDVSGRRVATLIDGWLTAGSHTGFWSVSSRASGIYLLRLSHAGDRRLSRVAILR